MFKRSCECRHEECPETDTLLNLGVVLLCVATHNDESFALLRHDCMGVAMLGIDPESIKDRGELIKKLLTLKR